MKKTLLVVFFLFALFLRLYKLDKTPEALTWDEAALGYNSYSLLKTGADEYGYKFPLVLRSFDDYKPALYSYLSIPPIAILGLNIFSIRMLSALSGASMVFSLYFLGRNLTGKDGVGILAAALVAASPVLLLYSRIALEANLSVALFTAGLAFITKKESTKSFIAGSTFLLFSAYAYHSARYIVPLVIVATVFYSQNRKELKKKFILSVITCILYLPIIYFVANPVFNSRFQETSILTKYNSLTGAIVDLTGTHAVFEAVSRGYFYLLDISGRYLSYFNPYSIFVKVSGHGLYHLDGLGVLNLFEMPFWIFGVYILLKNRKKVHPLIFPLIAFTAVPAAVTVDWFSPLRALLLWPIYLVVTAYGIAECKRLKLVLFISIFWAYFALRTIETAFIYQPYAHAGEYQYGFAQVVPYVDNLINSHKYSEVIIDTPHAQPHIFFLTFGNYPPEKYHEEIKWRVNDYSARTNFDFGPYTFRDIYWPDDRNLKNTLFVGDVFSLPYDQLKDTPNAMILKEFKLPDGGVGTVVVTTNE